MDTKEALKVIQTLNDEVVLLAKKKISFKKYAKISLIFGVIFLALFIAFLVIFLTNKNFTPGFVLIIIFASLGLIMIEAAMIFHIFAKYYYGYKEENRKKILSYIAKELNIQSEKEKNTKV